MNKWRKTTKNYDQIRVNQYLTDRVKLKCKMGDVRWQM